MNIYIKTKRCVD